MTQESGYEELIQKIKDLEKNIETYRTLVDNSQDLFYRTDLEGRITFVSPSVYQLTGYTAEETVGMNLAEEIYRFPEERAIFLARLREKGAVVNFEAQLKRKDGSIWWVSTNAHLFQDAEGAVSGVEGIARDISALKQVEISQRAMEERFRMVFQTSPDAIILSRFDDGTIIDVNEGFTELTGFSRGETVGKTTRDLKIWQNTDDRKRLFEGLVETGRVKNLEAEFVMKDGRIQVGLMSARILCIEDDDVILSVTRNISERKQAEKEIAEREQRFRDLTESTSDWIWEVDHEGRYTYASPKVKELLGYDPEEVIGKTPFDFMPANEAKRVLDLFTASISSRKTFDALENINLHKNGYPVVMETSGVPVFTPEGAFLGYRGIDRDISERKRREELTQSLNRLNEDLLTAGTLTEKLKRITDGIVKIFNADFARIWIIKDGDLCLSGCMHAQPFEGERACAKQGPCLHLLSSSGRYTHVDGGHRRVPLGSYKIGQIASGKDTVLVTNDILNDSRIHDRRWAQQLGLKAFAAYRLRSETGKLIGVLALFSKQSLSSETSAMLEVLSNTASQVIHSSLKEDELRRERDKLQDAIAEIKTLSGMLPICSNCKKIRDDKGYWNQIENYLHEHSNAQFSHSLCPECARTLYPELTIFE